MIKNEQIEEMRKEIYCARSKVNGIATSNDIAERLYSAGYRKVLLDTENGSCVDCIQYAPWQLVERKIEELKSEYKQLEKENEELKAKLEARLTCEFVKTAQKHAQVDVLNKVKVLIFQKDNPYSVPFEEFIKANAFCGYIDELIKEIQSK